MEGQATLMCEGGCKAMEGQATLKRCLNQGKVGGHWSREPLDVQLVGGSQSFGPEVLKLLEATNSWAPNRGQRDLELTSQLVEVLLKAQIYIFAC